MVNYSSSASGKVEARGTAGGEGNGGPVTISLVGSQVDASGVGSPGIFAQSDGISSGKIQISIDRDSSIRGGQTDTAFPGGQDPTLRDVAGIRLMGGTRERDHQCRDDRVAQRLGDPDRHA